MNDKHASGAFYAAQLKGEALKPCPFCGGSEFRSEGKYLPPTMSQPGALISWEIMHWCEKVPGVVAQSVNIRGREKEDAIAAWNTRALVAAKVIKEQQ